MKKSTGALKIAAGIFLSRVSGLVRDRVFAHYFGNSLAGDAFRAAMRIPNFLQNLFGEGVLSASFIPVYANLLAKGDEEEARKLASYILTWLTAMIAILVALGVTATPLLIDLIAPGFKGERRELTISLVQVIFPGTGLLVLAAWCLGVLNSHRHFFLSYVAPVACNIAMIATFLIFGQNSSQAELVVFGAWGFVAGTFLQLLVQLPTTLKLLKRLSFGFGLPCQPVRTVLTNFIPVVVSRGVVQISAYVDTMLASLLPTGALSALSYAQTLYVLPVSLFGMSISASQLPAMSSHQGDIHDIAAPLRNQLESGLRQIAYLVTPSVVAFALLGDVIVGAIYRTGQFDQQATRYVWIVLAGYSLGLLAATLGRLYSSTFYALRDTRTPLKFALLRVFSSTGIGYIGAIHVTEWLGLESSWGTLGLTLAAGMSAWLEYFCLRASLEKRIGPSRLAFGFLWRIWGSALLAGSFALGIHLFYPLHPLLEIISVMMPFGFLYAGLTSWAHVPESRILTGKLARLLRK